MHPPREPEGAAPRGAGNGLPAWRRGAIALVLLACTVFFVNVVNVHYPIREWLFWRYVGYATVAVLWSVACVTAGYPVIRKLLGSRLAFREHLVLAFPAGVFLFQLGVFLGGLLGLLRVGFFFLLPLALFASGFRSFYPKARSFALHVRACSRRRLRSRLWVVLLGGAGVLAVGLLYFQILSPDTLGFDARWYHMALAEHYAALHGIERSGEGWFLAAYPQLATHLFTWAFLLPGITFDKVELAMHLEVAVFIGMLAAIPVAVRKLVPRAPSWPSWVVYFLFPQIFLYDSNLNGGADHVAALFALPLGLTLLRAWTALEPRACAAFAVMASGVILTKYSAYPLLFAPIVALAIRSFWLALRSGSLLQRLARFRGPAVAIGAGLLLTTPHWLKNWIWYGDPFFPILRAHFRAHPFTPEANDTWVLFMRLMSSAPPGLQGVSEAIRATVMFPFEVHDWPQLHRNVPIFGALFSFTALCLPFLRARARLWCVYGASFAFVFLWYFPAHYERYLRATMPWMVAATAATLVLVWRAGLLPRVAAGALVLVQAVWGGDVYFFPTHNMVGDAPVHVVSMLMGSGFMHAVNRLRVNPPYWMVGEAVPPGSRLLLHEQPLHLGVRVASVSDLWQGRISYGRLETPSAIFSELRDLGVTHLLWNQMRSDQLGTLASDIAFFSFATRFGVAPADFGPVRLAQMPNEVPSAPQDDRVGYWGCIGPFQRGIYRLSQLDVPHGARAPAPIVPLPVPMGPLDVPIAVFQPDCRSSAPASVLNTHVLLFRRGPLEVYMRREPRH